jgi:hypothetical protein
MAEALHRGRIADAAGALGRWLRAHAGLVAFCAAVGLYYFWTARSSGRVGALTSGDGYYNLLADAFLHGQLHLVTEPSKALLALPNPYDPAASNGLRLHDLSLYKDHYYLYWGPSPAVVLFMPLSVIGIQIAQSTAVALFAFVGFCFSIAVLRVLVARFAPGAPRWMVGAAALALAFGNALPFTLRRPEVYEVAITAAFCFCFISLYLVVTALRGDDVNRRRLAAASVFIGLAVGSRPTMLVPALALVGLAFWLWHRSSDKADGARILAAVIGPLAVIGLLLGAYNMLRFGSPFEFGQRYQLAYTELSKKASNQLSYAPPGFWYYLFSPPELTLRFPFIQLAPRGGSYPLPTPNAYTGLAQVSGLLVSVPFTLFAFAGLVVTRGRARVTLAILCAIAVTILFFTSIALWGATMRYEVDFASLLLIAAAVGWLVWAQRLDRLPRKLLVGAGTCLIAWGVVFGVASGMTGYYDSLRRGSPATYNRFERYTAFVPTLGSRIKGRPVLLSATLSFGDVVDRDRGAGVGTLEIPLLAGTQADLVLASGSARPYGLLLSGVPIRRSRAAAKISVFVPQTGSTQVITARSFPPRVVPLKFKRGLNHIVIAASAPPSAPILLTGVRLVPLPPQ